MNKRKGISLIVLVITILVMIILAGVVVVSLQKNNPVEKAKEAKKITNFATLKELLSLHVTNKFAEGIDKKDINYTTKEEIAKIFEGKEGDLSGRIVVREGELFLTDIHDDDLYIVGAGGNVLFSNNKMNPKYCIRVKNGATVVGENIVLGASVAGQVDGGMQHTYGPYIPLKPGTYRVILEGKNLNRLDIDLYDNHDGNDGPVHRWPVKFNVNSSELVDFTFTITEKNVMDFEMRLRNGTSTEANPCEILIKNEIKFIS